MKTFYIILTIILITISFSCIRVYLLIQKTKVLIAKTTAFQKPNPNASIHILMLGDSTMFGTGAKDNKNSTAGRMSSLYPDASLENISENGLKLHGLNEKIKNINNHYDLIVIQIGANDIIRFTPNKTIDTELDILLTKVKTLSDKVIILHSGDVGESKLFPLLLRPFLTIKSKAVRDIYLQETKKFNVSYVDLLDTHLSDSLYADDKLHLNDEGYGVWFNKIKEAI
jgi:lysophospholipase L1-like esterase